MNERQERVGRGKVTLWIRRLVTAILLIPYAWLLAFWSLVIRARIVVGEWPHPRSGNPFDGSWIDTSIDPKEFGIHNAAVWIGSIAAEFALVFGLVALTVGIFWSRVRTPRWAWITFLVTSVACVVVVKIDPGDFALWFID